MAFTIVASETFGFADGNAGHVCTFSAGAPTADDFDVLCTNSDTTVSTPAGFSAQSAVTNQGAYIFRRKAAGGEGASVTVTTTGNFNCHVIWVRIRGGNAADITGSAQANGTPASTTPAFTSSALNETGELALAFAALHAFPGAGVPTSPNWSAGYTNITSGFQGGTSLTSAGGFVAYKTPAGTATESPVVTWTNDARNRYMLFLSITADPGIDGILAATLPALAASAAGSYNLAGALSATLPALTTAWAQTPNTKAASTAALTAGRTSSAAVTAGRTSNGGVT